MTMEAIFFVLLGLILGSFGNVLLYRIARGQSIDGRSKCPHCHTVIRWFDLIPVLSYLLLRGHCRHCDKKISIGYPMVEVASGGVFLLAFHNAQSNFPVALLTGILLWGLLLAAIFDHKRQQIPDLFTGIIGGAALMLAFLGERTIDDALLGAALGTVWFGLFWVLSRGKAVGSGDIFLAATLGLWLGLFDSITMLLMSYIIGAVVIVLLLLFKIIPRVSHQHIPFAPFLAFGALSAYLGVGDWYLQLIGMG